jgi:tetratricopeptide (TPR) repeat protein
MLKRGIAANPYLLFSENLLAQAYIEKGIIDSAFYYSSKAFYGLPNNALHAANFARVLSASRNTEEIKKAVDYISEMNDRSIRTNPVIWKNFILAYGASAPIGDPEMAERINKAVKLFPNDQEIKNLQRVYLVGQEKVSESNVIAAEALEYYNNRRYIEAADKFAEAAEKNFVEYSHFENAASAYFLAGDYGKAFTFASKVIDDFKPMTGKSQYLKALILINWGDIVQACNLLNTAVSYGYFQAEDTIKQQCNN